MEFNEIFAQIKKDAGDVDTSFEEKGSIGSGGSKFKITEDGVYDTVIDMVIFKNSKSSKSAWYEVTFKTEVGQKITSKMFVLTADGVPYKINDKGIKKSTFGWNRMAGLNYIVNNEWDGLPVPEEKDVMVYDYDKKSDVLQSLPVVTSLVGKPVTITVKMQLEDGYPDATVSREVPDIRNILDSTTKQSATEKRNGASAQVVEDFKKSIENNPDPIDKRDKSKGSSSEAAPSSTASSFSFNS